MSVAVLVNLRARRGTEAIARMVHALLPSARVTVTRSLDDARRWVQQEILPDPPTLLLSCGGDGTAVAILNELRSTGAPFPPMGVLPLGTGNGWAHVTGAPRARKALNWIAALADSAPPLRHFALVDCEGRVAPFAGTGWDAEIVSDFQAHLATIPAQLRSQNAGLRGYLTGMVTRTIPRHLFGAGPARVKLVNLGDDALTVDDRGRLVPLPLGAAAGHGSILYEGPASVAAAATTTEWGFGFRAFPFADHAPGRLSVRIYAAGVLEATRNMFKLWRGDHPVPKMHDFFVTRARMEFDRAVPFHIGGDLAGMRDCVEFGIAAQGVDLVDWRALGRSPDPLTRAA